MDRDEWGIKRVCQGCGTRFYDFGRSPIICPSCGTIFDETTLLKKKKSSVTDEEDGEDILGDDIIADENIDGDGIPLDDEDSLNDEKD